ncbi:MAG: prepilin-type N-terminal cleavage/methylation domain-containing protein [Acidobacteriota bacterium]
METKPKNDKSPAEGREPWLRNTRGPRTHLPARASEQGFSLIEVLIVVAIIGIIANVAIPAVLSQLAKAKATRLVTEYKFLQNAEFSYRTDTGDTPARRISNSMPEELQPYLQGQQIQWNEGTGNRRLRKYFIRETRTNGGLIARGITGGLMFRSRDTALLDRIEDVFTGPSVRWSNGRILVLQF